MEEEEDEEEEEEEDGIETTTEEDSDILPTADMDQLSRQIEKERCVVSLVSSYKLLEYILLVYILTLVSKLCCSSRLVELNVYPQNG